MPTKRNYRRVKVNDISVTSLIETAIEKGDRGASVGEIPTKLVY